MYTFQFNNSYILYLYSNIPVIQNREINNESNYRKKTIA